MLCDLNYKQAGVQRARECCGQDVKVKDLVKVVARRRRLADVMLLTKQRGLYGWHFGATHTLLDNEVKS